MLTGAMPLIPVTKALFDVAAAPGVTPDCVCSSNGSGARSQAAVVTLKGFAANPAMLSVAEVVVLQLGEAVWRTHTACPGLMMDADIVKVPVQPTE